jgi:hypothetical protein
MTDDEKKSLLALMIGDIAGNPYFPLFTVDQYGQFLTGSSGNVQRAVVTAATSASFIVAGNPTREVIGDLQTSNNLSANYLKALDYLIKNASSTPPSNLMPWFGGMDSCQRNKLLEFTLCDRGC